MTSCETCAGGVDFPFTFAFQPIVDVRSGTAFSYEALVRGPVGESAESVLERAREGNPYAFDRDCRGRALRIAAGLGLTAHLNINFLPNAVYDPLQCIQTTLAAAHDLGFPPQRIIFEVTEGESVPPAKLLEIFSAYSRLGFRTAIDDFGAGYSGLGLLSEFQPDFVKLDMQLVRGIDRQRAKQVITSGIVRMCTDLGVMVIAEGVETHGEYGWLRECGITLFQGFLFGAPAFEALVPPDLPASA